ncbi:MAG: hypothetical protein RR687_15305, partial [Comamonas sp.]
MSTFLEQKIQSHEIYALIYSPPVQGRGFAALPLNHSKCSLYVCTVTKKEIDEYRDAASQDGVEPGQCGADICAG